MSGQAAFDKLVRPAALCRGVTSETELNGVEEEHDGMPDEEGNAPFRDWCVHCMMGRGRTHHYVASRRVKISAEGASSLWITSS